MSDFFSIKDSHEFGAVCSGIPKYPPNSETQRNCAEIWLNLIVCKQGKNPTVYQECFKNFCAEKFGHKFIRWEGIWWDMYVYLPPTHGFPLVLLSASQNRISSCHTTDEGCNWQQISCTQKVIWFLKNMTKTSFSKNADVFVCTWIALHIFAHISEILGIVYMSWGCIPAVVFWSSFFTNYSACFL